MLTAITPPQAVTSPAMDTTNDSSPQPLVVNFTVTDIVRRGSHLWGVTMVGPDNQLYSILIPDGIITMETVRLSATAAAQLWSYKIGATPIAETR